MITDPVMRSVIAPFGWTTIWRLHQNNHELVLSVVKQVPPPRLTPAAVTRLFAIHPMRVMNGAVAVRNLGFGVAMACYVRPSAGVG